LNSDRVSGVGTVVNGRVISGVLRLGTCVRDKERDFACVEIESRCEGISEAREGDFVGLNVRNISKMDLKRTDLL
jgi:translation elongation factor EF-1alpha